MRTLSWRKGVRMFSLEEKIKAVNLVRDEAHELPGRRPRACLALARDREALAPPARRGAAEGCAAPERGRSPPVPDLDNLPDDPEELKRIIFDMRFEMDLKQAVVDILKKRPRRDPRTLSNRERALLAGAFGKRIRLDGRCRRFVSRRRPSTTTRRGPGRTGRRSCARGFSGRAWRTGVGVPQDKGGPRL